MNQYKENEKEVNRRMGERRELIEGVWNYLYEKYEGKGAGVIKKEYNEKVYIGEIRDILIQTNDEHSEENYKKMDKIWEWIHNDRKENEDIERISKEYPVYVWRGDMTKLKIECIVNAANCEGLGCFQRGHRCIDNVIHDEAGPRLRRECREIMKRVGKIKTGENIVTEGYYLPSKKVIHTVGPIVVEDEPTTEDRKELGKCYMNCLEECKRRGIREIAFCNISTGVFGYPEKKACKVAITKVKKWLEKNEGVMDKIVFVSYTSTNEELYKKYCKMYF